MSNEEEQVIDESKPPYLSREEYFDERRLALEEQYRTTQTLDKSLIALSGGALVLSITFIKQIAGSPPEEMTYMMVGWACFAMVILSTSTSLFCSQKGAQQYVELLDLANQGNVWARSAPNRWYRVVKYLNIVSIVAFVVGVGLLAYFSYSNLPTR